MHFFLVCLNNLSKKNQNRIIFNNRWRTGKLNLLKTDDFEIKYFFVKVISGW